MHAVYNDSASTRQTHHPCVVLALPPWLSVEQTLLEVIWNTRTYILITDYT